MSPPSSRQARKARPIRILIVDDSAYMRYTISKHLSARPGLAVVGLARDGEEALRLVPELQPDVITLDVEMPRMDGLSALSEIMAKHPTPVVMLSSLTKEGTDVTIQALTLGAVDFIAKPDSKANVTAVMDELIEKIKSASQARIRKIPRLLRRVTRTEPLKPTLRPFRRKDKVVVIGTSTGGPKALKTLLPAIPPDLEAAILIVQHMPARFTRSLAERLNMLSPLLVKEAEPEEPLEAGKALLAPGGFHMTVDEDAKIQLDKNPPMHGVRPAVDATMASVAHHFPGTSIGVVRTGMGRDGANGSMLIHDAGGHIIAEAEETCVVWGMPRSVVEAGVADRVLPLPKIAKEIERSVREGWCISA